MLDNEVYTAIRQQILVQMNDAGFSLPVVAGYQPMKQQQDAHSVFFFLLVRQDVDGRCAAIRWLTTMRTTKKSS
ncbi:hypothetical protein SAMN05216516_103252 [Izhakiella capsodis]|uniref:Uncharacterized protein n=1 Tax=Izhakiella capsodis TaxID=1367852 RepID=A0A1I4X4A3_9GAMM|nr:hypothetical protein SAMN05216516_103252 [Izhakiella capsodis]